MTNKKRQLDCGLFQKEYEMDRIDRKSSTFAGSFLLILKAFLVGGPSKSQSRPADLQWIVCDDSQAPPTKLSDLKSW